MFGAAFPLFTTQMYARLGIHWASSIPAFLAIACLPFPFLFYHYGRQIRLRCKFASEAAAVLEKMRSAAVAQPTGAAATEAAHKEKKDGDADADDEKNDDNESIEQGSTFRTRNE